MRSLYYFFVFIFKSTIYLFGLSVTIPDDDDDEIDDIDDKRQKLGSRSSLSRPLSLLSSFLTISEVEAGCTVCVVDEPPSKLLTIEGEKSSFKVFDRMRLCKVSKTLISGLEVLRLEPLPVFERLP